MKLRRAALLFAVVVPMVSAGVAHAAISCSRTGDTVTIALDADGDRARVALEGWGITINGTACDDATLRNTAQFEVTGSAGSQQLTIDQSKWFVYEGDQPRMITWSVDLGDGYDSLRVVGEYEALTLGTLGVNLASYGRDALDVVTTDIEHVTLHATGGILRASGGRGTGDPFLGPTMIIGGGQMVGGNGDDVIVGGDGWDTIFGRGGADEIRGGAGHDFMRGGTGNDAMFGGRGANYVDGGPGDDALVGGYGYETYALRGETRSYMSGGPGADTFRNGVVTYWRTEGPVQMSPDGIANDGATGEGDNIGRSVRGLVGSKGDDVLIGSDGRETLNGHLGDDQILGGGDGDIINGGEGNDELRGEGGSDLIDARDDAVDDVDGGPHDAEPSDGDRCLVDDLDLVARCELGPR